MNHCNPFEDELLRMTYGGHEAMALSTALRAHLRECPQCNTLLRETRETLRELNIALQPAPLTLETTLRIRARLDALSAATFEQRTLHRSTTRMRSFWSAAAAALLLLAWNTRSLVTPVAPAEPSAITLSEDESALVADAFAWLYVDETTDMHLEYASERLDTLRERLNGGQRALPWDADDDWDLPRSTSG